MNFGIFEPLFSQVVQPVRWVEEGWFGGEEGMGKACPVEKDDVALMDDTLFQGQS